MKSWHGHLWVVLPFFGCFPHPHDFQVLHEIELDFKSGSSEPAKALVTLDSKDTLCANPSRTLVIRDGESKNIPAEFRRRKYEVIFPHDSPTGFRLCLEQDGGKYLGAHFFHFHESNFKVNVSCEIPSGTKPTEFWTKSPYPGEYFELCRVTKIQDGDEEEEP